MTQDDEHRPPSELQRNADTGNDKPQEPNPAAAVKRVSFAEQQREARRVRAIANRN